MFDKEESQKLEYVWEIHSKTVPRLPQGQMHETVM